MTLDLARPPSTRDRWTPWSAQTSSTRTSRDPASFAKVSQAARACGAALTRSATTPSPTRSWSAARASVAAYPCAPSSSSGRPPRTSDCSTVSTRRCAAPVRRHSSRASVVFPTPGSPDSTTRHGSRDASPSSSTHAAATARSSGVVTFIARACPGTTTTCPPAASTMPASSVCRPSPAACACARSRVSRRKPCGVCTARRPARSGVPVTSSTSPWARTALTVSVTGSAGTTAACPARTACTTRSKTSGGVKARAASCTSTMPTSPGRAPSPARTEATRSSPPATTSTVTSPVGTSCSTDRTCATPSPSGGATTTRCRRTDVRSAPSSARQTSGRECGREPTGTSALGRPAPRRAPWPAATRTSPTFRRRGPRRGWPPPCPRWSSRRARAR